MDAELRQWAMIAIGLAVGTLARWALLIRDRVVVTKMLVLTDLMLMGALGLLAKWTVGRLGLSGEETALIAVLFALSSERILKLVMKWFERRVDHAAGSDLPTASPVMTHDEGIAAAMRKLDEIPGKDER